MKGEEGDTVLIEMPDRSLVRVPRSQVLLEQKTATVFEVEELLKPMYSAVFHKAQLKSEKDNRFEFFTSVPSSELNHIRAIFRNEDN